MNSAKLIKATHPSGATITFDPVEHKYTLDDSGEELISSTTFLAKFFPAFEAETMASRCAKKGQRNIPGYKYNNMSKEEIISLWDKEAERGRSEGNNVHQYAEYLLKGKPAKLYEPPISARCEKIFTHVEKSIDYLAKFFEFLEPEQIIFDPKHKIAGTVDLPLKDKRSGDVVIADWKQSKKISFENRYSKALVPINHLDSAEGHKYGIQLSIYEHLYRWGGYHNSEQETVNYRRGVVHLTEHGFEFIKIRCYASEFNAMLTNHLEG